MGTRAAIELDGVTLAYGDVVALDKVTLSIAAGERVCVLGANGSGKSSLASVISGLAAPDAGGVRICGHTVRTDATGADFAAYAAARRHVGLVFQNPDDQIVTTVVADDVAFGPENLGVAPAEIGARVWRELARVGMTAYADANPANLSGGQKQRVAIAGALAMQPAVLVLDEPGALLDVRGRRGIMRVMGELHDTGATIVHVTHFMDEALAADRVIVLDGGRVVLDGTPSDVFAHGETIAGLGLELPFAARAAASLQNAGVDVPFTCNDSELATSVAARLRASANGGGVAAAGVARTDAGTNGDGTAWASDTAGPDHTASARDAIVKVDRVAYSYAGAGEQGGRALAGVTFSVARGSRVAIVGHTGSGKSTLLRLLSALTAPDAGTVSVDGTTTATRRGRRRLLGRVGYVMQHPERQLFAETVADDVAFGPRNLGLSEDEVARCVNDALALVGLSDRRDASPFQLSGGQQRLCAIAGVVAMRPRLIVLDEPTAGLDPRGRARLRDIVKAIQATSTTVVEVTHSMDDAATADQVVALANGAVLANGTPDEVFSSANAELLRAHGLGLPAPLAFARRVECADTPSLGNPLTINALVNAIVTATMSTNANAAARQVEANRWERGQAGASEGGT